MVPYEGEPWFFLNLIVSSVSTHVTFGIPTIDSRAVSLRVIELLTARTEIARYPGYSATESAPQPPVQGAASPGPSCRPSLMVVHEVPIHYSHIIFVFYCVLYYCTCLFWCLWRYVIVTLCIWDLYL